MTNRGNGIIGWTVALGDIVCACFLMILYFKLFPQNVPYCISRGLHSSMVVMTLSIIITSFIVPSVVHRRKMNIEEVIRRNIVAISLEVFIFSIICRLMTHSGNFIIFGVTYGVLLFMTIMIVRCIERILLNHMRSRGRNSRSVLFVGSDPAILIVYKELIANPATGYRVLGYYSDGVIENAPESMKKLGNRKDLDDLMKNENNADFKIDEMYCSLSHSEGESLRNIMSFCDKNVIHFYYVPRIFSTLQLSLRPELFGNTVIFTNHHEPLHDLSNRLIKRVFDILVSAAVLLIILPFIPLIAIIIKLQSPGPIFFKQERTGLNGTTFMCYKFRSMHVNDKADTLQATKNDPRKFSFGSFMRKTNIDEFPQFYNVLRGDMSIVGPRPHMVYHTEKYSALINKYMVRHFSKPGITGYAQITGFRGETEELWQMEGRIQKDIWYIENWSLWLDIKIVFLTAWSIIHPDKAAY